MTARTVLAWAAAGMAAFTLYGSLVPFEFRSVPLPIALRGFRTVLSWGVQIGSRSDTAANVILGVPLGFALLGAACADRGWPRMRVIVAGLLLWPTCVLFAAGVEFAQLYTTTRYCALADILAQAIGAALGMAAWVLRGQRFTDRARAIWTGADLSPAGTLLVAYLALLALVQVLPLDLSASPADLYRKLRDQVRYIPFSELSGATDLERWGIFAKQFKLVGLFAPVGLLLARARTPFETWRGVRAVRGAITRATGDPEKWSILFVAMFGLLLAGGLETAQLLVKSRSPAATDVLVSAAAVVAAWYAARLHHEGLAIPFAVSWFVVWLAAMTPVTQAAPGTPRLEYARSFDWIPGLPLESGHPLFTLEEMLTKLVLFGLLGVIVAAWRLPPRVRRGPRGSLRVAVLIAGQLGLLTSAIFENAQRWTTVHTPCITDVLLGGAGAVLGVLAASRLSVGPASRPANASADLRACLTTEEAR